MRGPESMREPNGALGFIVVMRATSPFELLQMRGADLVREPNGYLP